jgi:hypothetical protein
MITYTRLTEEREIIDVAIMALTYINMPSGFECCAYLPGVTQYQDIIIVATADSNNHYTIDVNLYHTSQLIQWYHLASDAIDEEYTQDATNGVSDKDAAEEYDEETWAREKLESLGYEHVDGKLMHWMSETEIPPNGVT